MSIRRTSLPATSVISSDRAVLKALRNIPDYDPHNLAHGTQALIEREAALQQAELDAERARLAFDAARERLIAEAWGFHDDITGAKDEVVAQFGADSQSVHAIGLKRKSDRKRPARRASAVSI